MIYLKGLKNLLEKIRVLIFHLIQLKIVKLPIEIAISYVSIENAKVNLMASKIDGGINAYKKNAESAWDSSLAKIKIESPNADRKTQFYTHLYHSLIHPNIVSDINGEYIGADFKVHKTKLDNQI